ncbi:MAG: glycoside hydrolase family 172 protein [Allomuricauda sp.]
MNSYKQINHLLILFLSITFGTVQAQNDRIITLETLLQEMTNRASLAEWPKASYTCKQASSYSRDSKTKSTIVEDSKYKTGNFGDENAPRDWGQGWFENHDFDQYIRTEVNNGRKEDVMFEDQGAGAITRFWATYGELATNYGGIYRVYIDGNPHPTIEMHNLNFAGKNGLIGKPFSFYAPEEAENPMWRGRNLILPIPYAKSCKITYDGAQKYAHIDGWRGHYYQINYRTYEPGTQVESFNRETIAKYKDQIEASGKKLMEDAAMTGEHITKGNVNLKPGKSLILNLKGQKALNYINTKIKASNQEQALRSTVLKIEFDGHPTVWCPIGQFYGLGYKQLSHRTYYVNTTEDGNMKAHWVMPFSKKAKISLINYGNEAITVEDFQIGYTNYQWTKNTMYFHATWKETRALDTELRSDYNFITIKGKGVFVGDNLTLFNTFPDTTGINWWGEGDEKIYVDGETFPSHFGTGTEDYYCYAWCRPQSFNAPHVSQPIGEGNKTPGNTSNNRYRLLDAIPFTTDFTFDMEIWHPFRARMNYSPATFFYAFTGAEWNAEPNIAGVQQKVALKIEDVPTN